MFLGTYNKRMSSSTGFKLPSRWVDAFRQSVPEGFDSSDPEESQIASELRRLVASLALIDLDDSAVQELMARYREILATKPMYTTWRNEYDGRDTLFSTKQSEYGAVALYTAPEIQELISERRRNLSKWNYLPDNPLRPLEDSPEVRLLGGTDSIPWFELEACDEPRNVSTALQSATSELTRQARGKKLEDDIVEALSRAGFDVHQRIRLMGAEVDILVCGWDAEAGSRTILIECKEQSESQTRVALAPVMRLFGLRTAAERQSSNNLAVMVSTTGYTRNARLFSQAHGIALTDHRKLLDHLDRMPARPQPLLRTAYLDSRNNVRLPNDHIQWIGESELTVIGSINYLEVWGANAWQPYEAALFSAASDDTLRDLL